MGDIMGTVAWVMLGGFALGALGGFGQLMNGPNREKGLSSLIVGILGIAAVLYFSWGGDPDPQQAQLSQADPKTTEAKASKPLPSNMLPIGHLAEGRPWSNSGAAPAATPVQAQPAPPAGGDLGMTLDQVEARFSATARKHKIPMRLDQLECSTAGVPTCMYLVRTGNDGISSRFMAMAEANAKRRVTKIAVMFRNEDAGNREVAEAMVLMGGILVMLSPQLGVEERGTLLKALVEGFVENDPQSQTVSDITYRLTSAGGEKAMLFAAERSAP